MEESASFDSHTPPNFDSDDEAGAIESGELDAFRREWQSEINQNQVLTKEAREKMSPKNLEEQAQILFCKGIQAEQDGALYEAIHFYKRAMQLVPDIEHKIDFRKILSPRDRQESESSVDSNASGDDMDLVSHLQKMSIDDEENRICQKEYQQRATHISALPVELLMYIFKWVVSSELDMRMLEVLSEVCRGFHMCARDEELWKLSCLKIWGMNCSRKKYKSWRKMFIEKPHILFNGCYISQTSYVRQGEKGLDNLYRAWHYVQYYRYARFFPNGVMLMMTSADDPQTIVSRLKYQNTRLQGVLKGFYQLTNNKIIANLQRAKETTGFRYKRQQRQNQNEPVQVFRIVFDVKSIGRRKNVQLLWNQYSIRNLNKLTGEENESEFDLGKSSFPPMNFARVRSYTSESDAPLG